jgi:hypothetical protein
VIPGSGARIAGGPTAIGEEVPRSLAEFHALTAAQRRDVMQKMSPQRRKALLGVTDPASEGYL